MRTIAQLSAGFEKHGAEVAVDRDYVIGTWYVHESPTAPAQKVLALIVQSSFVAPQPPVLEEIEHYTAYYALNAARLRAIAQAYRRAEAFLDELGVE